MVRSLRSGRRAVPVPIDLALPRFAAPDFQTKHLRWVATQESPSSPSPLTSPSLCLNLNTLSSGGSSGPGDISAHPICISDVSSHSSDLDQILSGDDLPSGVHVDLMSPASPTVSARVQQSLSHYSPAAAPVTLSAESSALISPNHVRSDWYFRCFRGSPHATGFPLRAGDTAVPASPVDSPAPSGMASDRPPQLGEPVAFNLSQAFLGRILPVMSFPVYPLPSSVMFFPDDIGTGNFFSAGPVVLGYVSDSRRLLEGPVRCLLRPYGYWCPLVSTVLPISDHVVHRAGGY